MGLWDGCESPGFVYLVGCCVGEILDDGGVVSVVEDSARVKLPYIVVGCMWMVW